MGLKKTAKDFLTLACGNASAFRQSCAPDDAFRLDNAKEPPLDDPIPLPLPGAIVVEFVKAADDDDDGCVGARLV